MSSLHVDQAHPAAEAVASMNAALDEFAAAPLWSIPTRELADLVVELEKVSNRLDAAKVASLAQAETSLVRTLLAAKTTHGWLKAAADVPSWMGRARLELAH